MRFLRLIRFGLFRFPLPSARVLAITAMGLFMWIWVLSSSQTFLQLVGTAYVSVAVLVFTVGWMWALAHGVVRIWGLVGRGLSVEEREKMELEFGEVEKKRQAGGGGGRRF